MSSNTMLSAFLEGLIIIIFQFWYLFPVFILPLIVKTRWFKGKKGEFLVNAILNKFLDKNKYHLIKNVTLPTRDGTTQIDHIVVSTFGVFVLETKNMKGLIVGTAKQKLWTQQFFKKRYQFQNPLHQNYKHTQTLADSLNVVPDFIYSMVVFVGDSTFKTKMPENVTHGRDCVKYIKTKNKRHFTTKQVAEIISAIDSGRLSRSFKTNRLHNKHVKDIVAGKAFGQVKACSKCGSKMVLRVAKRGHNIGKQFWGCSDFPKCKATVAIIR